MYKVKVETNSFGNDSWSMMWNGERETNSFGNDSWSMMWIRWK